MCNRQLHDTNHYQMTYSLVPSYYILQTNLIDPPMIHQFVSVWPRQPRLIIEPLSPFFLSFVQIIQIMQNRRSEHAEATILYFVDSSVSFDTTCRSLLSYKTYMTPS